MRNGTKRTGCGAADSSAVLIESWRDADHVVLPEAQLLNKAELIQKLNRLREGQKLSIRLEGMNDAEK